MKVMCSPSIAMELNEYFAFEAPGARFSPLYKSRIWDGKIRLFGLMSREMYVGLYLYLHQFCKERSYDLVKEEGLYGSPLDIHPVRLETLEQFAEALKLTIPVDAARIEKGDDDQPRLVANEPGFQRIVPRDFQMEAFYKAIRHKGKLLLSPTASGKSLIIYLIIRYLRVLFKSQEDDSSILLIVPTTGLVEQMYSDFKNYSSENKWPVEQLCSKVYAGLPKDPPTPIVIATWQGIYKMPKAFFARYRVVIGDEAHQYKAKSLVSIMTKATEAEWRIGTTGTLDDLQTNKLVLEGLFGSVQQVSTTRELMDAGTVAKLKIKCIVLKYPEADRRAIKSSSKTEAYEKEVKFLIKHERRNKFIRNLALSQTSNTLVLFTRVEDHGRVLEQMIREKAEEGRKVFFVYGDVAAVEREKIRHIVEAENNAIIIASFGTFSTGINIRNLHRIIMAHGAKGRIRNLQSIGRGLRLTEGKEECTLFDISDDLQTKTKVNFSLQHLMYRIEIYNQEGFDYNIIEVPLA